MTRLADRIRRRHSAVDAPAKERFQDAKIFVGRGALDFLGAALLDRVDLPGVYAGDELVLFRVELSLPHFQYRLDVGVV